ncbi:hypothetical protein PGTUg99_012085 [Puccinia graminis f. sp. tritici]|uniref:Uncharacterized protein n=1 Tax=Puccinia graminis f. sp. tritici TaxID=56615 RepID=A0A5B0SHM2_PUCGR|nr:hypothetical protein PGTUg99_012085 [Puccinia graminis f. sp. tritici]
MEFCKGPLIKVAFGVEGLCLEAWGGFEHLHHMGPNSDSIRQSSISVPAAGLRSARFVQLRPLILANRLLAEVLLYSFQFIQIQSRCSTTSSFLRRFRVIGQLTLSLRAGLVTWGSSLTIKKAGPSAHFSFYHHRFPSTTSKEMTSPPPPRSYYSISSDYSPTQSFDEDGDSFTSFGSVQTPPRLRAMIRSIFDGTLNSPICSFPDSDYGDTGSLHESVTDPIPAAIVAEGLNEGETFGDHRAQLLASAAPPYPIDASASPSSDPDGEYELDDSTAASIPDIDADPQPIVTGSADLNGFCRVPDATSGETFWDRRDRLLVALAPPSPGGTSAPHSSIQDKEYELNDYEMMISWNEGGKAPP